MQADRELDGHGRAGECARSIALPNSHGGPGKRTASRSVRAVAAGVAPSVQCAFPISLVLAVTLPQAGSGPIAPGGGVIPAGGAIATAGTVEFSGAGINPDNASAAVTIQAR